MNIIPAKDALERLANIASTAANILQASNPHTADRFKNDEEVARAGLEHLKAILALYNRATEALDDYHDLDHHGAHPLAIEMRTALNPPPHWVAEAVAPPRRAGP